ncbi:MAG: polysaccharide deacetylase family protein [Polyangiaceae bacterium]
MPAARILFWVATSGALALFVRSFLLGPVPLFVAAPALGGYVSLVVAGYVFPRWGMFADVIEAAEPGRKLVALTFDDGPNPSSTPFVLDTLAKHGAKATFFVIGRKAQAHPSLIERIIAEGHELGIHGYQHSRVTAFRSAKYIRADIARAQAVLAPYAVKPLRWFRPPIGHVTPRLASVAKELGLVLTCWSIRGLDGLPGVATSRVERRVLSLLRDGAIVALHDSFEREPGTPAGVLALPAILADLERKGLRSVTLAGLLDDADST